MNLSKRIPEPELMNLKEQAEAYWKADFSEPHNMFIDLFGKCFGNDIKGTFLDLGCGTCDITIRFVRRFKSTQIHAVDGAGAMLYFARKDIERYKLKEKIKTFCLTLPFKNTALPTIQYDGVIINSLLHHLSNPNTMWEAIKKFVKKSGIIFVMDLIRPENTKQAKEIVERYSGNEPNILKQDFYNSLLAAYRIEEVKEQLKANNLSYLDIKKVSDRHFIVWGHLK